MWYVVYTWALEGFLYPYFGSMYVLEWHLDPLEALKPKSNSRFQSKRGVSINWGSFQRGLGLLQRGLGLI